jgi:hypothetical protein
VYEASYAALRPDELTGVGARIYSMARDAGHDQVAEWVIHLFGHATCPHSGAEFIAEWAGEAGPDGRQHLLGRTARSVVAARPGGSRGGG